MSVSIRDECRARHPPPHHLWITVELPHIPAELPHMPAELPRMRVELPRMRVPALRRSRGTQLPCSRRAASATDPLSEG